MLGTQRSCTFRSSFVCHSVRRDPSRCSLLRFRVPPGIFSRKLRSTPFDASTSPGIPLPFGASVPAESTVPGLPTSQVTFRVQGFSPSSRLAPPPASRVCFTPLTPFGLPLQGVPLSESCRRSSRLRCRPAVAPVVALPRPSIAGPPAHEPSIPRKMGRVPLAGFTALLPLRVRAIGGWD